MSQAVGSRGRLVAGTWTVLVVVGLVGQLAWTVENLYLNVFIYDTITDDPAVIAITVAASAATATVATLLVGAASDRLGRRRVFVVVGYLLWGVTTAGFGFVTRADAAALVPASEAMLVAVVSIVVLDCVMSFFGSGANDAAFQAWVTDITDPGNRGRVDSVLAVLPLLAMLVVFVGLDGLTRAGEWRLFFGIIGAAVAVAALVALVGVTDRVRPPAQPERYLRAVVHGLRPSTVRDNPMLYVILGTWCVWGISTQVFLPYLLIYLDKTLHLQGYALLLGVVLIGASIVSVLGGRVMDRVGKHHFLLPALGVYGAGLIAMLVVRDRMGVMGGGLVLMSGFMLAGATLAAMARDVTPEDRAGHVQGLRMVFVVLLPMLVGPFVGAAVIKGSNETYVDLGVVKQVPTANIFLAAAAILVLSAVLAVGLVSMVRRRRAW